LAIKGWRIRIFGLEKNIRRVCSDIGSGYTKISQGLPTLIGLRKKVGPGFQNFLRIDFQIKKDLVADIGFRITRPIPIL